MDTNRYTSGDNIFVGLWQVPKQIDKANIQEELPHVSKANQGAEGKSGLTSISWDVSTSKLTY